MAATFFAFSFFAKNKKIVFNSFYLVNMWNVMSEFYLKAVKKQLAMTEFMNGV